MRFEDLDIKPSYDSRKSDVFNEFFNTVLPHSKHYRRFGGIFSAKKFALMAEGLQDFIKENDGMMELAIIPGFSQKDREDLMSGVLVDEVIARNWIDDLSKIKEKILEDHTKAIAWMVANEHLAIKVILPEHSDGTPFTEAELSEMAIFRREIGIFYNRDDNSLLSFHGVIDRDDSEMGELYALDVSRNWVETEKSKVCLDHEEFTNYWNGDTAQIGAVTCKIQPLSNKLVTYFEEYSPKTKADIPELKKMPVLRGYQIEAIDEWLKNGGKGIFEMATGTGKTFAAIGGMMKARDKEGKMLVVIAAPYRNLIDQWKRELKKWFINAGVLEAGIWRQMLHDEVSHLNRTEKQEMSVLIASHDLFSDKKFVEQIESCRIPVMLLVDEAHHVGTFIGRNGLSPSYSYRLALSATISRYFDDDGTDFLRDYFKGPTGKSTVIEYSLEKAIKDNMLCGYNYYPFFVELTGEELDQYRQLTYRAVRLLNSKKPEDRERGEKIIQKRAKIVRDAKNKMNAFREILGRIERLEHLLVFCSENQFDHVESVLNNPAKHCGVDRSLFFRRITYESPPNKKDRTAILNDFAGGNLDILLSNRILDEGMDIPQARGCIVLASTGNPAQFIQRRGRVLRTYSESYKDGSKKTHADIFDVLVKPQIGHLDDPDSTKLEVGMIKAQLTKIKQMSSLAMNREHCMEKIKEFTYGMQL